MYKPTLVGFFMAVIVAFSTIRLHVSYTVTDRAYDPGGLARIRSTQEPAGTHPNAADGARHCVDM